MSEKYGRSYFEGEGYKGVYFDFPIHYKFAEFILNKNPMSVIEVGGARGYVTRLLKNSGVNVLCMDISDHCWHTRAIDEFLLWDATIAPWPEFKTPNGARHGCLKNKEFDLCVSIAFFEHIPEEKIETVIKEMIRVSNSGLHGITFNKPADDSDKTHVTFRSKSWWEQKFKEVDPNYPVEIFDKDEFEKSTVVISKYAPADGLTKLNVGSFTNMFHYGWTNIDALELSEWAKKLGFRFERNNLLKGLNYPNGSVDVILASHFLEHLCRNEGDTFLAECSRVLRPGGLIRLALPNTALICKTYLEGKISEYRHVNAGVDLARDDAEAFFNLMFSGHETLYDVESLRALLKKNNFTNIQAIPPFESRSKIIKSQTIPAYPSLSFYIEANSSKNKRSIIQKKKINVGLLSTMFFGVPPVGYSGLEQIVWDLACGLDELGHNVTLFAPKGSHAPPHGKLIETGEAINSTDVDWFKAEQDAYQVLKDNLSEIDILHGHNWFGFEYLAKLQKPDLKITHTHHGGLNQHNIESWSGIKQLHKLNLIAISDWMSNVYASKGFASRRCYNGIDLHKYKCKVEKDDRFMFLGRIAPSKAPHLAIEAALRAGAGLDIVGSTSFVNDPKYVEEIKHSCDGEQIKFIGEVDPTTKVRYLQNAKGLLIPSRFGEPFGLISIESMACGTPPIAFNDGALKEIIIDGETGFICNTIDEMVQRMKCIESINPNDCRKRAQQFSRRKMAKDYVNMYEAILSGYEW
jgi:glycosyltransferase involved in cell wall biosynthesis/predicted SAM-dependent methyltransferase